MGLQEHCWDLVKEHMQIYNYSGPVGLSCDETKLFAAFHPYFDCCCNVYYLLGNTGELLEINDPEDFADVMREGEFEES